MYAWMFVILSTFLCLKISTIVKKKLIEIIFFMHVQENSMDLKFLWTEASSML